MSPIVSVESALIILLFSIRLNVKIENFSRRICTSFQVLFLPSIIVDFFMTMICQVDSMFVKLICAHTLILNVIYVKQDEIKRITCVPDEILPHL